MNLLFRLDYFDLLKDTNAALLMSQIHYWYLPGITGKDKLRVKKEGKLWLAKSATDWWKEIRLTPRQIDRAISILVDAGLIVVKLFKFAGCPVRHFYCQMLDALPLDKRAEFSPISIPNTPPNMTTQLPSKGDSFHLQGECITEITTETTTEIEYTVTPSVSQKPCLVNYEESTNTEQPPIPPTPLFPGISVCQRRGE